MVIHTILLLKVKKATLSIRNTRWNPDLVHKRIEKAEMVAQTFHDPKPLGLFVVTEQHLNSELNFQFVELRRPCFRQSPP